MDTQISLEPGCKRWSARDSAVHSGLKPERDVVFQTINIMYDCHDENYDGYDIHTLTNVGVNIFNIDMTQHDAKFFHKIKDAIQFSATLPEMIPTAYYTPVGISVTMSAMKPVDIDDRVDIIILKDLMSMKELRQFKKQNKKISSLPILFWPPTLQIEDLGEIIKISAGIVLDPTIGNANFCDFQNVLRRCKEDRKPIFYMNPTIVDDYYEKAANDRRLLIQVQDLVKNRFDGLFLKDRCGRPPVALIQALIRAIEIIENEGNVTIDYFTLSLTVKIPVLQPYAVAMAACLAALQCEASAIIVFTTTGTSAKILSFASPPCRVLAITRHEKTARRMHLFRKVMPLHYQKRHSGCWQDDKVARIAFGTQFGLDTGLFNFCAKLVVLAPSDERVLYCNSFYITTVKRILLDYECGHLNRDDGYTSV